MDLRNPKNGEKLICPVCNKEFKATDNTRFIINNGWTCSWHCFITEHKKQMKPIWDKQKAEKKSVELGQKKRRGRKRKSADSKINSTYNNIKSKTLYEHNQIFKENSDESLSITDATKIVKTIFTKTELL